VSYHLSQEDKVKEVSVIFGTRPEAIKLHPLILTLKDSPALRPHVCVTAQHREMLDQILDDSGVVPDVDLDLIEPGQSLASLTSRAANAIDRYLAQHRLDLVLVQGDTTTSFCAALAAFYRRIPVGHVEAGLRTWNKFGPFPEEINRRLISQIADIHFAPTQWAKGNLVKEGVPENKVIVTGNTGIDALQIAIQQVRKNPPSFPSLPEEILYGENHRPLVLITGHRRENFGNSLKNICRAISELSKRFRKAAFVYPVHLNPEVAAPVFDILSGHDNIHLIEPLEYLPFVALMDCSTIVLTDSGGIQEEAPYLGKPVLVMRDTTERPEAVDAGTVRLVGTDVERITESVSELLTNTQIYTAMARAVNPYGDGKACKRIVQSIIKFLNAL
jgi:UDP-N-acetylglucosamine 2-epimerase (non-hydrolysing)